MKYAVSGIFALLLLGGCTNASSGYGNFDYSYDADYCEQAGWCEKKEETNTLYCDIVGCDKGNKDEANKDSEGVRSGAGADSAKPGDTLAPPAAHHDDAGDGGMH